MNIKYPLTRILGLVKSGNSNENKEKVQERDHHHHSKHCRDN
jgi:hypothetical protein